MNNEERDLQDVREGLGCIQTCYDPSRRVYVSRMPEEAPGRLEAIETATRIIAGLIECGCCMGMLYLVFNMLH